MGKKSQQAPAPVYEQSKAQKKKKTQYEKPLPYRSKEPAAPVIDYAAENERRRREALKGQATDIVNSRLSHSQTQANLYGTRHRAPSSGEFSSLVSAEFDRLLKMDSGQQVEDLNAGLKKRKYEGFKKGRGMASDPLSDKGLLGG